MGSRIHIAVGFAALVVACGATPAAPRAAVMATGKKRTVAVAPPKNASSFWHGLELSYDPDVRASSLPIDEADLVREQGAAPEYARLKASDRELLLRDGFVLVPTERARTRIGAFYTDLEEGEVPILLTVDTFSALAHLGISAAIAEADTAAERPALEEWLTRVEARLTSERKNAPSDLIAAYEVALGFVAVARSLDDDVYVPPVEVAGLVTKEKVAIAAHDSVTKSPLFGVPVDYRAYPTDPGRRFRAWLALAPFSFGNGESDRPKLDVSKVRTATKAALLLARASEPRIDARAAAAYDRARSIELFFAGASDDPNLRDLGALAKKAGIDLTDGATIAKVVRVDALRVLARETWSAKLLQGEVGGCALRVLGSPAPPDGIAMQSLVAPSVPLRFMPSGLDVAAWLGSEEARRAITARGDDKLAGYDRAMTTLFATRPNDPHASLYASALDAIGTMLAPSVSTSACPGAHTHAMRAASLDSALASWTTFRSDFSGARIRLADAPSMPQATPHAAPRLVFVEPKIEAIASLTALVRQTKAGLDAMHAIAPDSPAHVVLSDIDQLLTISFEVALLAANDEAPTEAQRQTLSTLPAWMAALEASLDASTVRSVIVHVDHLHGEALEETTAPVSSAYVVFRDPADGKLLLTVGAHVPHAEKTARLAPEP